MARSKIRDAVKSKKTIEVEYEQRSALYANKCDACGKVFSMTREHTGSTHALGEMSGRTTLKNGTSFGNTLQCIVCSFTCAQAILDGKWKELPFYKERAGMGVEMVEATVTIGVNVQTEADIVAAWENTPEPVIDAITRQPRLRTRKSDG